MSLICNNTTKSLLKNSQENRARIFDSTLQLRLPQPFVESAGKRYYPWVAGKLTSELLGGCRCSELRIAEENVELLFMDVAASYAPISDISHKDLMFKRKMHI
jgi:hypothetical protein